MFGPEILLSNGYSNEMIQTWDFLIFASSSSVVCLCLRSWNQPGTQQIEISENCGHLLVCILFALFNIELILILIDLRLSSKSVNINVPT